jgi:hypothetical protein
VAEKKQRDLSAKKARNWREKWPENINNGYVINILYNDKKFRSTSAKYSRLKWEKSGKLLGNQ